MKDNSGTNSSRSSGGGGGVKGTVSQKEKGEKQMVCVCCVCAYTYVRTLGFGLAYSKYVHLNEVVFSIKNALCIEAHTTD